MVVAVLTTALTTALLIVDLRPEIWKDLFEGRVLTLVALGFSLTAIVVMLVIAGARRSWAGFQGKTVWDFLQLLIVPLMLVAIGLVFSLQQDARQQRVEDQRVDAERDLAEQRAQDEALQAYLDQMSNLLLERNLRESAKDSEVRTLARARTLTVLSRLDSARQVRLLQFLYEAGLLHKENPENPVIDLNGADLSGIDLPNTNLSGGGAFLIHASGNQSIIRAIRPGKAANLSGAILSDANLERAALEYTQLSDADLSDADLSHASLRETNLYNANLSDANLSHVDLHQAILFGTDLSDADLSDAILSGAHLDNATLKDADLSGAILSRANLSYANLSYANLNDASGITNEELEQQARSLEGATMPNGQKYEDWLKSKGRGEEG
jgi:uncharacterized protein YjbI with pentapeptide repeats